jgi:Lon protease-like protein
MESTDDDSPLIFRESIAAAKSDGNNVVELALMPFPTPLFPGSREFLYIYEMRFRTLMNDAEQLHGGSLGRCYISDQGAVGKIGTRCTIVEQQRLPDGKGFFIVESIGTNDQ